MVDHDAEDRRDYHLDQLRRSAVETIDRAILDSSDGSTETTNELTAKTAMVLLAKAAQPVAKEQLPDVELPEEISEAIFRANLSIIDGSEDEAVVLQVKMLVAVEFVSKVGHIFSGGFLRWKAEHPATD